MDYGKRDNLDYVGLVWVGETNPSELHFLDFLVSGGVYGIQASIDTDVGVWDDMDYEQVIGSPVVVYEKKESDQTVIKVRAYINGAWSDPPIPVDVIGSRSAESYLDMDIADGYVYIAYSKEGNIYCAILDFFQGNRPE